jgi:porphobilinogen synthase
MVKPGYPYLDVVKEAFHIAPHHPIAVYQVSGEYSMLYHAAVTHNLVSFKDSVMESIEAYLRAGASLVITYFTPQILEWLKESS